MWGRLNSRVGSIGRRTRIVAALFLVLVIAAVAFVISGSGATTSRAEARSVAAAETRFLKEWRHAYDAMTASCAGLTEKAAGKCVRRVELPLQDEAMVEFTAAIEAMLEEGVGPECSKALKETRIYILDVPYFPGESTVACRQESRA